MTSRAARKNASVIGRSYPLSGVRGVPPDLAQLGLGDVVTVDETVYQVLIQCVPPLHGDVIDGRREPGVANQREPKLVGLLVAVRIADGDYLVPLESNEDRGNRLERRGRPQPDLPGRGSTGAKRHEKQRGQQPCMQTDDPAHVTTPFFRRARTRPVPFLHSGGRPAALRVSLPPTRPDCRSAAAPIRPPMPIDSTALLGTSISAPFSFRPS